MNAFKPNSNTFRKKFKSNNMHMPGFPTKPNGHQTTVLGREKSTISYFTVFGTETTFLTAP